MTNSNNLTIIGAIVAIFGVLSAAGMTFLNEQNAYADQQVQLPVLSTKHTVGDPKVWVQYMSDNRYEVHIVVQYQVDTPLQVPENLYVQSMTGDEVITVPVQEEFIKANTPTIISANNTQIEKTRAEIAEDILEKAKSEQQLKVDDIALELAECQRGLKGWAAFVVGESYEVYDPAKTLFAPRANLQDYHSEVILLKALQECIGAKNYVDHIKQWENYPKAGYDLELKQLDETDSPLTYDVTPEMLRQAEEFAATLVSNSFEFDGINRGNPYDGESKIDLCQQVPVEFFADGEVCPIKDKTDYLAEDTHTLSSQEDLAKQLQCKLYMPQYQHLERYGTVPAFLSHCLVEEETSEEQ